MPTLTMAPTGSFLFRNLDRIYKFPEIVRLRLGLFTPYLVTDPAMIQEVLVTKQGSFMKGRYLQNAKKVFGEGLLTSEGSFHHRQRRLVQPSFHHGRIGAYAGIITEYQRHQARTWNEGQVVDIHREMMKLTMSVIAKCLFNKDVETEAGDIVFVLPVVWLRVLVPCVRGWRVVVRASRSADSTSVGLSYGSAIAQTRDRNCLGSRF